MKKINNIRQHFSHLLIICLFIFISSCEEIIEIELNSSHPVINAEGRIEPNAPAWLKLSYTSDYFENNAAITIDDAEVWIVDNDGNTETLEHTENGLYLGERLEGRTNKKYTLYFTVDDKTYEASSILNPPTKIEKVWFEETEVKRPGGSSIYYSIHAVFRDHPKTNNFYLLKFWINDEYDDSKTSLIRSKYFVSEGAIEYAPRWMQFDAGDDVKIAIYSIDEQTYTYYSQLNDLRNAGMGGSSTPYNPQSNFGNDIMGYFTAWSYDIFDAKVQGTDPRL